MIRAFQIIPMKSFSCLLFSFRNEIFLQKNIDLHFIRIL
ncbi:hypothetical protein P689_12321 [Candidatus Riesia pediculischaeffi PTSU]|uniref:Uncharacterized protein n=1 Tax=Candidatus Riesia pediculischaeffi PTSU TaxID=1401651 RepID=A0A0C1S175_9ENTR|nr:hypothetical protein P689_12321 [Candidatus Riesia pediculischaeffi PTSU]